MCSGQISVQGPVNGTEVTAPLFVCGLTKRTGCLPILLASIGIRLVQLRAIDANGLLTKFRRGIRDEQRGISN